MGQRPVRVVPWSTALDHRYVTHRGGQREIDNHHIGRDMNTLDSDSCWNPASIQDAVGPILTDHMANIKAYQEAARSNNISIGYRLRELLVPILNRWGIGWDDGIWLSPTVIEGGPPVRISCNALYFVHKELSELLDSSDGLGNWLGKYVEPIPVPLNATYVWVTSYYKEDPDDSDRGTLVVEGTIPLSLTAMVPPLPIVGNHYHGPITQEYYDDVVSAGGSLANDACRRLRLIEVVQNLPTYKAGPDSTWIQDREWDRDYYYPGMYQSYDDSF